MSDSFIDQYPPPLLKRIIVPNLPRRTDRRYANLGALVTMGVPHNIIEYFPARDALDYVGQPDAAVDAALAEGFNMPSEMESQYRTFPEEYLKYFCQRWTFTVILKVLSEDTDPHNLVMFLVDDFFLRRPFHELRYLLRIVNRDRKRWNTRIKIVQLDRWTRFEHPYATPHPITVDWGCVNALIGRGLGGLGDAALLLNSEGASILYNLMCKTGGEHNLEGQLWTLSQRDITDQVGFYSIIPERYFVGIISSGLR